MKILGYIPMFLTTILCAVAANGQTPRVIDNFDLGSGVKIYLPQAPAAPTGKSGAKKVKAPRRQTVPEETSAPVSYTAQTSYTRLSMGSVRSLHGFTTGDAQIDSYIEDSCRRYNIDPLLIYSQMHQESSFKLRALSNKGASGLMQLMPATAARFGVRNIFDPRQNIDAGVRYMRWLLDLFNQDVQLALAGYNAGEGAVIKYGYQIPPYRETREYVRRISARYAAISDPRYVQGIRRVTARQATKLEEKEARPLTVLEPKTLAVRLPDGRMRLVND